MIKQLVSSLFLILLAGQCSYAQDAAYAYFAEYKSSGYSMTRMDDGHFIVFNGPGIQSVDTSGFSGWKNRYLTSGISHGKIRKAANGELLMMVQHASIGAGNGDVMFFRMDSVGNIRWIRVYGTANKEVPADFTELPDGDILLLLTAWNFNGPANVMVLAAIDQNGDQLWQRSYMGDAGPVTAKKILHTGDGKLYLCGNTVEEGFLIRTDFSGNLERSWAYPAGFPEDIEFEPSSQSIYLAGRRTDPLETSITGGFVMRQDTSGRILWQRTLYNNWTFGGSAVLCLSYDPYNRHVLAGGSLHDRVAQEGDDQAMTMVFDTSGTCLSGSVFGSTGMEYLQDICVMSPQSIFWSGFTNGFGSDTNILMIKTGPFGVINCPGDSLTDSFDTTRIAVYDPGYWQDTGNLNVSTFCFPPTTGIPERKDLCSTSSVSEMEDASVEAMIVPNPNPGDFLVQTGDQGGELRQLEMYNAVGQLIRNICFQMNAVGEIKVRCGADIVNGMYFLRVQKEHQQYLIRVMISK